MSTTTVKNLIVTDSDLVDKMLMASSLYMMGYFGDFLKRRGVVLVLLNCRVMRAECGY